MVLHSVTCCYMLLHIEGGGGGGEEMLPRAVNKELISLVPRPGNEASSSGDQIPVVTMVFILLGYTFTRALKISCERSVNAMASKLAGCCNLPRLNDLTLFNDVRSGWVSVVVVTCNAWRSFTVLAEITIVGGLSIV